jgi:hypothetical protein
MGDSKIRVSMVRAARCASEENRVQKNIPEEMEEDD